MAQSIMPPLSKSLQGQLILDGGKLQRSFFHRSVVLVCQHDPEGAFGLILNRETDKQVGQELVANLPLAIKQQPLFIGGPVQPQSLSFLHSVALLPDPNIMASLSLGHSIDALMDLGETFDGTQKLRLFAGYAGWSAGQLDNEMARRDWLVHPASLELIFHAEPAQLWKQIMKQKDIKSRLLADSPDDLSWN
jgi:putative transcriptional regulator